MGTSGPNSHTTYNALKKTINKLLILSIAQQQIHLLHGLWQALSLLSVHKHLLLITEITKCYHGFFQLSAK